MGCFTCGSTSDSVNFNGTLMPCDVCKHISKDKTPKKVAWCDLCSAHICEKHWDVWTNGNMFKRVVAAALEAKDKLVTLAASKIKPS